MLYDNRRTSKEILDEGNAILNKIVAVTMIIFFVSLFIIFI